VKSQRVAFLTASTHPDDGWGRFTTGLLGGLTALGVDVTLLTVEGDRHLESHDGIRVHDCLPNGTVAAARHPWAGLVSARRLVHECSVIHCLAAPYAPLGRWLAGRRRFVVTGIGTFLPRPLRDRRLRRRFRAAYSRADALPCISAYTRAELLALQPELRNTSLIPPGVDTTSFHRRVGGSPDGRRRILSVGALKPRKGHEYTLRAFARTLERVPDAELNIIGRVLQRPYFDALRDLVRTLGVEERVAIETGLSDAELIERYQGAHLLALMSINVGDSFEGYGQVFAEAGACGVPGIGSLGCGAEDAIIDGETGLLVKQKDVDGYADAMVRVLGDEDLRERMADAAHALAQGRSWRSVAKRYAEIYGFLEPAAGARRSLDWEYEAWGAHCAGPDRSAGRR
jgi:glycosyltransferase involved in cell wall biosynthesis